MCEWGTEVLIHVIRLNRDIADGWHAIAVDACIAPYVQTMNLRGIITLGCCCGHGRELATVLVVNKSRELMDTYGYDYGLWEDGHLLLHTIPIGE